METLHLRGRIGKSIIANDILCSHYKSLLVVLGEDLQILRAFPNISGVLCVPELPTVKDFYQALKGNSQNYNYIVIYSNIDTSVERIRAVTWTWELRDTYPDLANYVILMTK